MYVLGHVGYDHRYLQDDGCLRVEDVIGQVGYVAEVEGGGVEDAIGVLQVLDDTAAPDSEVVGGGEGPAKRENGGGEDLQSARGVLDGCYTLLQHHARHSSFG